MENGLKTSAKGLQSDQPNLSLINWHAPWLQLWRTFGEVAANRVVSGLPQPDVLNGVALHILGVHGQPSVRFVSQTDLPPGEAYERYIFNSGQCPTREGLHDFFNGLAWLNFPQTKRQLNQLHMAQIVRTGIAPVRGPARDALTLFDENAALLRAPDALWNALLAKDWARLFGDLRGLWVESYLLLFGHALLEKLVLPRKSITAHVYRVYSAIDSIAAMDAWVATSLNDEVLAAKPFAHLPVLGVPGWWAANETAGFYDDPTVFRKSRSS
jgi:hypothetical protein